VNNNNNYNNNNSNINNNNVQYSQSSKFCFDKLNTELFVDICDYCTRLSNMADVIFFPACWALMYRQALMIRCCTCFFFYWISLWRYAISCKHSLWNWLSPTDTHTHSYSATQYSFSNRIPIALLSLVIAYSKLTARVFFTVQNHLTDVFLKIYV